MTEISYITQNGEKLYLKDAAGREMLTDKQIKLKPGAIIDVSNDGVISSKKNEYLKNLKLSVNLISSNENFSECTIIGNNISQEQGAGLAFYKKELTQEEQEQLENLSENEKNNIRYSTKLKKESLKNPEREGYYKLPNFNLENYQIHLVNFDVVEDCTQEGFEDVYLGDWADYTVVDSRIKVKTIAVICEATELLRVESEEHSY
jgi:hypothetical protein